VSKQQQTIKDLNAFWSLLVDPVVCQSINQLFRNISLDLPVETPAKNTVFAGINILFCDIYSVFAGKVESHSLHAPAYCSSAAICRGAKVYLY
jgi:hypothetical protein